MGSKKTKTKNEPWAPAQPLIIKGMQQTSNTFDQNQPRLQDMSTQAYDAFTRMAPSAFGTSPFVGNAQAAAQTIGNGYFLGAGPGQSTYDRLQNVGNTPSRAAGMTSRDPSMDMLSQMANSQAPGAGDAALSRVAAGGANPADGFARAVAQGQYLNNQPSAGLYSSMMGQDYLTGNPYLENVIAQTNSDVSKNANRMFGARGMGAGVSSAFADVVSKNLADNEGQLRYQNYNDASARQLQAAGQSDAAWGGERGRMDASTGLLASNHNAAQDRTLAAGQALNQQGQQAAAQRLSAAQALGGQYNAGADRSLARYNDDQNRALEAGRAGDASQQAQVQQMLAALGLTTDLRNAEYAGVAPALSLLNAAADTPYIGVGALNGNIRTASNGYGTSTVKTSGGLGGVLGSMVGSAANAFGGGIGTGLAGRLFEKKP